MGRGGYILRNLEDINDDLELVIKKLERFSMMYAYLEAEKKMLLQIEAGRKASAEILTEQLLERIKQ